MYSRHLIFTLAITSVAAAAAHAQTPAPKTNDVTLSAGGVRAAYPDLETYHRWQDSLYVGGQAGHYWTEHWKSEIEAAWVSPARVNTFQSDVGADGTAYFHSTIRFQDMKASVGQVYQFGDRAWVHSYLGVGLDLDYLRSTENRPEQVVSVFQPGPNGVSAGTKRTIDAKVNVRETTVSARPFVMAGVKMYMTDRIFFRAEGKVGVADRAQYGGLKTGIGVDF